MFNMSTSAPPDDRLDGPVSDYFELTHANYLVLDRGRMNAAGIVDDGPLKPVLAELWTAYSHLQIPSYRVTPGRWGQPSDFSEEELARAGIRRVQPDDDPDVDDDRGEVYSDGMNELDWNSKVFVRHVGAEPLDVDATIVVPRTLMQSMSLPWQERAVSVLAALEKLVPDVRLESKLIAGRMTRDGFLAIGEDSIPHYDRGRTYVEPRI